MEDTSITVITGPMFARKTTELINRIRKAKTEYGDAAVLVLKHSIDDRYDTSNIVSHDKISEPAVAISSLSIAWGFLRLMPHITSVFIDEGQFFKDLIEYVIKMRDSGRNVTIAGLDKDFRRQPFENMHCLTHNANTIINLSAFCTYCRGTARFTRRKVDTSEDIIIGASEIYEPVCARCPTGSEAPR